jgi:hypothetical protein
MIQPQILLKNCPQVFELTRTDVFFVNELDGGVPMYVKRSQNILEHSFLRFSTIFVEKIGVFLKNQYYYQKFFADFFGENILKIIISVLG